MNAKLIVEGKEFDIQIMDPELQNLIRPPKKNGYERVDLHENYWTDDGHGYVSVESEDSFEADDNLYNAANYYSDKTVAENNARADALMRKLRRFAVEHREYEIDWEDKQTIKYYIYYDYTVSRLFLGCNYCNRQFGAIFFRSQENAELAIDTFRDELIWYFTEYKDSL